MLNQPTEVMSTPEEKPEKEAAQVQPTAEPAMRQPYVENKENSTQVPTIQTSGGSNISKLVGTHC